MGVPPGFSVSSSLCIKAMSVQLRTSLPGTSFPLNLTPVNSSQSATKASCAKDPNIAQTPIAHPCCSQLLQSLVTKGQPVCPLPDLGKLLALMDPAPCTQGNCCLCILGELETDNVDSQPGKATVLVFGWLATLSIYAMLFFQLFCLSESHSFKRSMKGGNQSRESSRDVLSLLQSSNYSTEQSTWLTFMLGYLMQSF